MSTASRLIQASRTLSEDLHLLSFAAPTAFVYNPLEYARAPHELYLSRYGEGRKRVVFVGMNPGPFGMTQTGVPFGEIAAVRDWMKIEAPVGHPEKEHPKRRVTGFACKNSEVSGRRLWGLFAQRFGAAENFFKDHFVANYCPLVFMEEGGRNRTPDKLPAGETVAMEELCDRHLAEVIAILEPEWVIGVGAFAEHRALRAKERLNGNFKTGRVLHPSPASPLANRDWAGEATRQLVKQDVWKE
ncbi:MAG TPA: uracil-DNA glycosylase family protein [Prosthecobacter sp.]